MDLTMLQFIADAIMFVELFGSAVVLKQDRTEMCYRTGDIVHIRTEMLVDIKNDGLVVRMFEFVTLRELNPVAVMRSNRKIAY
jgi:hypothetical protein